MINELYEAASYEEFADKNALRLKEKNFEGIWKDVMSDKKIKKADVIVKADVGYTYFYDILRGEKHPSRDTLIKLCLSMELSVEEAQRVLYTYDWAYLYPDIRRDSIIIYAFHNKLSIQQTNTLLENYKQKILKPHK